MGLPREAENVVILLFAEQTNRSFFLHGAPCDATLTNLPGSARTPRTDSSHNQRSGTSPLRAPGCSLAWPPRHCSRPAMSRRSRQACSSKIGDARHACQLYRQRLQDRLGKLGIDAAHDRSHADRQQPHWPCLSASLTSNLPTSSTSWPPSTSPRQNPPWASA